jgi:hypothetical protein
MDSPVQPAGVHAYAYRIELESTDMPPRKSAAGKSAAARNMRSDALARIGQPPGLLRAGKDQ